MQGPHSFPSYVSLCVCDNEKRTSLEVPLFRLVTSTAVLCTRETYGYISNCTENTFQLLYRFPFTSLFASAVVYSTLFTNDLLFYLFSLSPSSHFETFDISIRPSLPVVFVFSVCRWLRAMKHWTWMILYGPDHFTLSCRGLPRSHNPGWTEFVLLSPFSSSPPLRRNHIPSAKRRKILKKKKERARRGWREVSKTGEKRVYVMYKDIRIYNSAAGNRLIHYWLSFSLV